MSSHEYEWDSFLEPSTVDMDVYVIHSYSFQPNIADESHVGLEDLNSHVSLMDDSSLVRINLDLGSLGSYLMDSDFLVKRDETIHIHNLELDIGLPLVHPNLIDWS